MLEVNSYFNDQVKSVGFETEHGRVTSGVMLPGHYRFGTAQAERMCVTHGAMHVKLPGAENFQLYSAGSEFSVPANSSFDVEISEPTTYLCYYL